MTFAEHMRNERGDLSQSAFCRKLGIPLTTYQRYETGERVPDINVFAKIVRRTGLSADTLLGLNHKADSQGGSDKKDLIIDQQASEIKKLRQKIKIAKSAVRT
jgi:transcriptional regulator with XRE-family HTH domain